MAKSLHFLVSGRVQGVFYRASAAEQARLIGITGWVKNLPDSRVEVFATGETDQLEELADWLREGPPHAKVSSVEVVEEEFQAFNEFEIRY